MHTKLADHWGKEQALVGLYISQQLVEEQAEVPVDRHAEAGHSAGYTVGLCSHPLISLPGNRASMRTSVSAGRPLG